MLREENIRRIVCGAYQENAYLVCPDGREDAFLIDPGDGLEALEAANLPAALPDLDFAVINGNYAIPAGIADKLLATEDAAGDAAQVFANIVAVRAGDETRPEIEALVEVLKSDEVKSFIEEKYEGSVLPVA